MSAAEFDDDDGFQPEAEPPSLEVLRDEAPRCTDSANADAVIREHGRGYLFVVEWEAWIAWDGKRWDRTGARARVLHAAILTARLEHLRSRARIYDLEEKARKVALAGQRDEDLERDLKYEARLLKWHEQSQNASRLSATVTLLETQLTVSLKALDISPWLLNVLNGTLDLRTAEMWPHRQDDLITHIADIEWDDTAKCPTWDAFVSQSMGRDLELTLYLQRLIGYALTGLTTEHILAFFHGGGSNGKSTFVQTIRTMLGEYACAAPRDLLFEDKNGQRHPTELARLYGKRMAVCAEIGEFVTLDEAKVKDLTGGDTISVRRMWENFWDLEPTHTLFVSGNHQPTVRGYDLGIWRRIRLVPWNVTVVGDAVDKDLPAKLKRELPGILRWAVQGCLEWQRIGLCDPPVVLEATSNYRTESDVLGEFLADRVIFEKGATCTREELRVAYETWCAGDGRKPAPAKKVAQRLKENGVEGCVVRVGSGQYSRVKNGWRHARLMNDNDLQVRAEPASSNLKS